MQEFNSFGYCVLRLRKAMDLSRAELAQRVGCAVETIKKIERDERRPSIQIAGLLADALGVKPDDRKVFIEVARGEKPVEHLRLSLAPHLPLPASPNNLPQQSTPFIGRKDELQTISGLLADPDCRLLTLTGPGGTGKTRLALQSARRQASQNNRAVYLVSLAGVESASSIPSAIASALCLDPQGQARTLLLNHLAGNRRDLLLVLDNFEHLMEGTDFIHELLDTAPQLKLLVTSRQRLNIRSEWVFPVEGLSFPALNDRQNAEKFDAVVLFIQTAHRVRANYVPSDRDKDDIVRICQMVEGLPLAIELAASWTRILTCRDIAREIEAGIDILSTPLRDLPRRHRSIQAVFAQSWKLLTEEENLVLARLSVFRGGFTRQAAERVAGASLAILTSLVDQSLIRLDARPSEFQRYEMHELIRQDSRSRLLEEGQESVKSASERHLDYYARLAEQAGAELLNRNQLFWLNCLDLEYDNIVAAVDWASNSEQVSDYEAMLRLVSALYAYFSIRGHVDEACRWFDHGLNSVKTNPCSPITLARASWAAGFLHSYHGDHEQARQLLNHAVTLCREIGPSANRDLAMALNFLGLENSLRNDLHSAKENWEESLALRRELNDAWGIAQSLLNLGEVAHNQGNSKLEWAYIQEGLIISRALGERIHLIVLIGNQADFYKRQGNISQARNLLEEALAYCRELQSNLWTAITLENLAMLEAQNIEEKSLTRAARLWGAANGLYSLHGFQPLHDQWARQGLTDLRTSLGETRFNKAWEEGQTMSLNQAIALALKEA